MTTAWPRERVTGVSEGGKMRRRSDLALAFCLLAVGCAPHRTPGVVSPGGNQESIQGDWELYQMNGWFEFGLPLAGNGGEPTRISLIEDHFVYTNDAIKNKQSQTVRGTFRVDDSSAPRQITFHYGGHGISGIYYAAGGRLILCFGSEDRTPPKVFAGGPGERPVMMEFRRKGPQKERP